MTELFQRRKAGGQSAAESARPRFTLAAFGKHPGWDDHIPGIGVETEALAHVKQSLYASSIGKQIDSGAWEKLEPGKRLEGFDHMFLWLRSGHVLMGALWSSSDGKGRSKYPMVLCVDGEGVSPGLLLTKGLPEIEQLRTACKAAVSAEQVTVHCGAAQAQLQTLLTGSTGRPQEVLLPIEARRRFLERREFGPDHVGLLRALHELGSAASVRSRHVRLPLACDSPVEALQLWAAFLRCAIRGPVPLLLMARAGVDWLDVIIGEPTGDELFCLQASPKALPLATEIPYELPQELKQRCQEVETKFLGAGSDTTVVLKRPAPAPVLNSLPSGVADPTTPRRAPKWGAIFGLVAVILIAVAGFWVFRSGFGVAPDTKPVGNRSESLPVKSEPPAQNERYDAAMKAGRMAFQANDYPTAVAQADEALKIKLGDAAAEQLKAGAQSQIGATKLAQEEEQKHQAAMKEGQAAFDRKDYTNAIAKADVALAIKKSDLAATRLKAEAKARLDLVPTAQEEPKLYDAAMKAGQAAFQARDYPAAVAQADEALKSKPGDEAASQLKAGAQRQIGARKLAQEQEQKYQVAMKEGEEAFNRRDYTNAMAKAEVALGIMKSDLAATKLKTEAKTQMDLAMTAQNEQQQYDAEMKEGQAAFAGKDYTNAIAKADVALGIRKNDKAATDLKERAATERDFQDAQTAFGRGNYDQALKLCAAHPDAEAFSQLAKKVEQKRVKDLDINLEKLLVWFGVLDPKEAKTPEARKEKRVEGEIGPQRDGYLRAAEDLEKRYTANGLLDAERQKNLKALKKNIKDHL